MLTLTGFPLCSRAASRRMRVLHVTPRRTLTDKAGDDALLPFVKTIAGFEQAGARGVRAEKTEAEGRTGVSQQSASPQDCAGTKDRARQEILPKPASGQGTGGGQSQEAGPTPRTTSVMAARTFANFTLQVPDQGRQAADTSFVSPCCRHLRPVISGRALHSTYRS